MAQTKIPHSPRCEIPVTEERIERAVRRHSSHCMIAEAIKDALPDAESVTVDLQSIRWSDPRKGLRYIYLTPRIAQEVLIQFDQGIVPEPFTLKIAGAQIIRMASRRAREYWLPQVAPKSAPTKKAAAKRGTNRGTTAAARAPEAVVLATPKRPDFVINSVRPRRVSSQVARAEVLLQTALAVTPVQRMTLLEQAKAADIKEPALYEARQRLGVITESSGPRGREPTIWRLPAFPGEPQHDPLAKKSFENGRPDSSLPRVVGGRAPPIANLSRRRTFGLKGFVR